MVDLTKELNVIRKLNYGGDFFDAIADALEKLAMVSGTVEPVCIIFTPTEEDFSGVMSYTAGQLGEYYEAGKRLVAVVNTDGYNFQLDLNTASPSDTQGLYGFDFVGPGEFNGQKVLLRLHTYCGDEDVNTYICEMFQLTPISLT